MTVRDQMERMGWSLVVDDDTLEPCWVKAARCGNIVAYHPFRTRRHGSATWNALAKPKRTGPSTGASWQPCN
jgi:hypothetical protein